MEEASKDQLKNLQNFFKQRNKQNEGINNEVIDHVGKFLSEVDHSKLSDVDKIQNNKIVNALGHFIVKSGLKCVIKSQALNGRDFVLEQPRSKLLLLDLEKDSDSINLEKVLNSLDSTINFLVILVGDQLQINAEELNKLTSPLSCKVWLFDNDTGIIQTN
jgi:hypothetical protein